MKKLSREERNKWIERGTTLLIVFLCVCCVYLFLNVIGFYKEQISISSFFWGADIQQYQGEPNENTTENVMNNFWQMSEPELVMACSREKRQVVSRSEDNFVELVGNINSSMHDIPLGKTPVISESDDSQWQSALENNAIYVRYDCRRPSEFEMEFYDISGSDFAERVKLYSELLFVPNMSSDEGITVFVKNADDGKIVKVSLSSNPSAFKNAITKGNNGETREYAFAYELNLDGERLDDVDNAATLSPMFLIPTQPVIVESLDITTPRIYKSSINFSETTKVSTELINMFGYNPNTVRQYANSDGAIIFVGETGSLSLHPEGKIEYRALSENEGVLLNVSGGGDNSAYSIFSGVSEIIRKVFSVCGFDDEKNDAVLKITELPEKKDDKSCIKFDYFIDEYKVVLDDDAAITATVKNGVLIELKMWVKAIEKTDKKTECEDVFIAIDEYCRSNPENKKDISGKPVYLYDKKNNKASAVWEIQGDR